MFCHLSRPICSRSFYYLRKFLNYLAISIHLMPSIQLYYELMKPIHIKNNFLYTFISIYSKVAAVCLPFAETYIGPEMDERQWQGTNERENRRRMRGAPEKWIHALRISTQPHFVRPRPRAALKPPPPCNQLWYTVLCCMAWRRYGLYRGSCQNGNIGICKPST